VAKKHVVREGECLASIAFENGFFPDTIWRHADNSALKERRENPNVLQPGDVLFIPI
jgi:N-acetylmuramoyl-L-alanine amidase